MSETNTEDISVSDALKVIKKAFQSDPEFKESYRANIAMPFVDQYANHRGFNDDDKKWTPEQRIDFMVVHKMANEAADRFLDIWMSNIS